MSQARACSSGLVGGSLASAAGAASCTAAASAARLRLGAIGFRGDGKVVGTVVGKLVGKLVGTAVGGWLGLLAGCSSVPDAGRLVDASVQLHSAIGASGSAVATELRAARRDETAQKFAAAWTHTERSVAGLVQYAEALGSIAQAGREGGESVQRVAAAGSELAAAVGLGLPAAGFAAAVDVGAVVYRQIALVRAAQSLDESLERMQPAVDRIAELIVGQLEDAAVILAAASQLEAVNLRREFADDTGYRDALQRERRALYAPGPLTPATAERLEQIDRAERIVAARLQPMEHQLAAGARRLRQSTQLIAQQAVRDWAGAHRQLRRAVSESRTLDPAALLHSVDELRVLVRKVREVT